MSSQLQPEHAICSAIAGASFTYLLTQWAPDCVMSRISNQRTLKPMAGFAIFGVTFGLGCLIIPTLENKYGVASICTATIGLLSATGVEFMCSMERNYDELLSRK